jgi:hypothetical protein
MTKNISNLQRIEIDQNLLEYINADKPFLNTTKSSYSSFLVEISDEEVLNTVKEAREF